jgi:mevalonate kinase
VIRKLRFRGPFEVVIGDTGIVANTKTMLAGVAERRQRYPERYERLMQGAREIANEAMAAIEAFDLQRIGRLMNRNQSLLQDAELSCPELEQLIEASRAAGALGAKLTGSGGGGCMLALAPGKELQEQVARAIEAKGFQALRSSVGVY